MRRAWCLTILLTACGSDPGAVDVQWAFTPDRAEGCDGTPVVDTIRAVLTEGALVYQQAIECRVGQSILLHDVEPGSYTLAVDGLDADDSSVVTNTLTGVQVDEGKTAVISLTLNQPLGEIDLIWSLPANCAADEVRSIRVVAYDDGMTVHDNEQDLYPCDDGMVTLQGDWIRTREYSQLILHVFGVDANGVRTFEYLDCDLAVESGMTTEIVAELESCGGDCCPGGVCRACP